MKYRRMDSTGDYTFGQGKYNFLKDKEAVGQAIKTNLLLLYNEWWEDMENGTPLFQKILSQRMTEDGKKAVDVVLKERILATENVVNLEKFESEYNLLTNTYGVEISVNTTFGLIEDLQIEMGV